MINKGYIRRAARTLLLVLLSCGVFYAQTRFVHTRFVHTRGKDIVSPSGEKLKLRGINLGNWFEPEGYMFEFKGGPQSPREIETLFNELIGPKDAENFWREYREKYITQEDVNFLARSGFNSVRVPLHYKFFLAENGEEFHLLDQLIDWCRQAGIWVILDLHCAPGGQTGTNIDDSWGYPWLYENAADQALTIEVWKRLAVHYRDEPTVLGYDLLNEPIPHYPQLAKYNTELEPLYRRIVSGIREVDNNHAVILEAAQWDTNFSVFGPPFDDNTIYEFHKYWTAPDESVISQYLDYRDKYKVPIWLGESGENTDDWISQFRNTLEVNNVGWCFWPYKKMAEPSAVVSFDKPVHWDAIVAYAKLPSDTGKTEQRLGLRPSIQDSREALRDLLQKIQFANCHINPGYLKALGLKIVDQ